MPAPERRTTEQVRGEIELERERLAAAIGTLESDAKRTGRVATIAFAAFTTAVLLLHLRRWSRGD